ncbi:uncharacterized protein PHACADRAFT_264547 [Phanerochaete carnosa HHB-10118-sp]|uniref:Cytochrome c oxidase subunit 8, mitochondrial n=1 Tax=Phanerochaete carnosa (strain HHB-10118-sp) TaxID=650164 RepID=K5VFU4_PHACS|nr:uncharacterized protein PHACADRAFT_264547 [Phanerochaete carnosa HHB-10118-sp]EKM50048.1 hypothetical protein PHACADRAFT_264547 [Phanerochaete carnosa HHB-10118-sp]
MSAARLSPATLRMTSRRSQVALKGVRYASEHHGNGAPPHLPFAYKNKGPFVAKLSAFCVIGFGLPFWVTRYSLKKSGGA